ncbi:sugar ABC transporter permease [Sansalvadorimonas sp. 2012CJ34-2]|uniref:Sugar ABC transporter permease n=1 Tax=Parendozoicomonas callyspongiae TaxID=2942213 RepID=A0ABT0PDD5_9GAMM|nr:sugar ABC transporter permease [Sansalvadorimonas sp. 2012CJ34-2]MCL6269382.1 sugar ABC transporter permease [Sansalvadorimonas sp. 2012CJ34-2]
MKKPSHLLGLGFMLPALIVVVLFFLLPVFMTAGIAFTNMSTDTGITGGAYELTPNTIHNLRTQGVDNNLLAQLETDVYRIDEPGLAALATDMGDKLAKELGDTHGGVTFQSRRELERAIKKLKNKPRSTRKLKKAAAFFKRSILNQRFETESEFVSATRNLGLDLAPEHQEVLSKASYTGWTWTTENFSLMTKLPSTLRIAGNTVIYVFFTLTFNVSFGLFLAITTFYLPGKAAATFRTIWFLPRILPPVIYVLMWKWLTWDTGFISTFFGQFGVPAKNWMLDTNFHAWVVIILINGFVGASMGMILFSSAIRAIPAPMLYASEVDGATRWQQVRYIILPQLRWPILFITSYQTLSLLTSFEYIFLATDGGPGKATEVWALSAFHQALANYGGNLQYGYGAALALVLVIIGIIASVGYLRVFNFKELVARPRIEQ